VGCQLGPAGKPPSCSPTRSVCENLLHRPCPWLVRSNVTVDSVTLFLEKVSHLRHARWQGRSGPAVPQMHAVATQTPEEDSCDRDTPCQPANASPSVGRSIVREDVEDLLTVVVSARRRALQQTLTLQGGGVGRLLGEPLVAGGLQSSQNSGTSRAVRGSLDGETFVTRSRELRLQLERQQDVRSSLRRAVGATHAEIQNVPLPKALHRAVEWAASATHDEHAHLAAIASLSEEVVRLRSSAEGEAVAEHVALVVALQGLREQLQDVETACAECEGELCAMEAARHRHSMEMSMSLRRSWSAGALQKERSGPRALRESRLQTSPRHSLRHATSYLKAHGPVSCERRGRLASWR